MQHPARLGWATALPEGYYLDELGQVRHTPTGDLVCGWSGRGHRHYLLPLPWPDPSSGSVLMLWVDRETMSELRRGVDREATNRARGGLGGVMRRLLSEGLGLVLGKVVR